MHFPTHLQEILAHNRLFKEGQWAFSTCSGLAGLEGILANMRTAANQVCLSDTTDSETFRKGGAWYLREVYTLFLVSRYDTRHGRRTYEDALTECRIMRRQILSRLLRESDTMRADLLYLDIDTFRSRDLGAQFIDGAAGLYFMIPISRPLDLTYNSQEWTE